MTHTVILLHHGSVTLVDARGDLLRPGSAGIVARFFVCVVDSWWWALSFGVVFSGGPCLLDRGGLSSLRAVKRRRQLLGVSRGNLGDLEFAETR